MPIVNSAPLGAAASKVKCKNFINPREYMGRQAAYMLMAGGYVFTSEDKQLQEAFKKFEKKNKLQQYMIGLETRLSQDGREIITINKVGEDAVLNMADPRWYNRVGQAYATDFAFVMHTQLKLDDSTIMVKETWTDTEIIREISNGKNDKLTIQGINVKLPEEYKIKEREVHNYGFIPAMEMFNLPYIKVFGDHLKNDWKQLADDAPGRELITLINNVLTQLHKEVFLNTTKVFGNFSQAVIDQANKDAESALGIVMEQAFINVANREGGKPVEVAPGDPKLTQYIDAVVALLNEYENLSNYSGRNDKREQQTVEETSTTQKKELATTQMKRDMRNQHWEEVIARAFVIMGITDNVDDKRDEWTFEIKEPTIKPRMQQLEESAYALEHGLSYKLKEVQNLTDLNETEAQKEVDRINKEAEEKQQQEMEMINASMDAAENNDGNEPKPTPDKKGE